MPTGDGFERWGSIGHEWAVAALAHAITTDRAAHAFLLTGPHGIGKTTLARGLARRLQCTGTAAPCGVCVACRKIEKGLSPDVRLVEGLPPGWKLDRDGPPPPRRTERERRMLKIEQVRELQPWLAQSPFESKFKIAILRRFEDANEETGNALLKTLEEPPAHVFLILTAQDANLLLPTIASRCQRLALRPLPVETVERALRERWNVPPEQARLVARLSGGRLGWAVRVSAAPQLLEFRAAVLDGLDLLLREGRAERLTRMGDWAKSPDELPQVLELWLTWWRDVLLVQNGFGAGEAGASARVTNVDREARLQAQAEQFSAVEVRSALQATRAAARQLEQNANARLVMEVLALSLPHAAGLPVP